MQSIKQYIKDRTTDELLLGALVFLLPFERIPSIELFGFSLRLSFFAAGVLILRALMSMYNNKFTLIKDDVVVKLLLAFLAWIFITTLFAINTQRAVQVAVFTGFTIATAIAIRELYRPKYFSTIISALLASASLVGLFGMYQYFANMANLPTRLTGIRSQYSWEVFGFPRIHSTALEPLYYCSYLLIPISYLVVRILSKKGASRKHALLFILLATSVIISLSRGGILAFIVVTIMSALLLLIRRQLRLVNAAKLLGLIAIAISIFLTIVTFVSREPLNKTITSGEKGASGYAEQVQKTGGDDRAEMRQKAFRLMQEDGTRLVIGIGPGQFGPYIQNNQADQVNGWLIVNNEPLELTLEYGLIGLLIFLIAMLLTLVRAWKSTARQDYQAYLALGLIAYCFGLAIQYQTFSTLYVMHVWVVIGLLMAFGTKRLTKA